MPLSTPRSHVKTDWNQVGQRFHLQIKQCIRFGKAVWEKHIAFLPVGYLVLLLEEAVAMFLGDCFSSLSSSMASYCCSSLQIIIKRSWFKAIHHTVFETDWNLFYGRLYLRRILTRSCAYGSATFRSGRSGLSHFGHGTFRSWSFQSRDISVRLWNLAEILYVHFLRQTY